MAPGGSNNAAFLVSPARCRRRRRLRDRPDPQVPRRDPVLGQRHPCEPWSTPITTAIHAAALFDGRRSSPQRTRGRPRREHPANSRLIATRHQEAVDCLGPGSKYRPSSFTDEGDALRDDLRCPSARRRAGYDERLGRLDSPTARPALPATSSSTAAPVRRHGVGRQGRSGRSRTAVVCPRRPSSPATVPSPGRLIDGVLAYLRFVERRRGRRSRLPIPQRRGPARPKPAIRTAHRQRAARRQPPRLPRTRRLPGIPRCPIRCGSSPTWSRSAAADPVPHA